MYQYSVFFQSIRQSIEDGVFEKATTQFMETYSHEIEGDGAKGHEDEIDALSLGIPVKKKRTLLL
jgi:hypothetical protein